MGLFQVPKEYGREVIDRFDGPYSFLSNFHYPVFVQLEEDENRYPSVEHAFQAAKTLVLSERREIWMADTPGKAKRLGRKVSLRDDWEDIKLDVMLDLLRQKFDKEENPELAQQLLDTRPKYLIEGNNWGDTFWGVCNGRGENHLGDLLVKVRKELVWGHD